MRRAAVACLLVAAACTSARPARMSSQAVGPHQEVRWRTGSASVVSRGAASTVTISPQVDGTGGHLMSDQLLLLVGVENHDSAPFVVEEGDVLVSMNGEPVKVWTVQELAASIRSRAAQARSAAIMNGALGPPAPTSFEEMNRTAQLSVGRAPDPTPGAGTLNAIAAREAAALDSLRVLLRPTTVPPGGSVVGWVRIAVPASRTGESRFDVRVNVAGEEHAFVLVESPAG